MSPIFFPDTPRFLTALAEFIACFIVIKSVNSYKKNWLFSLMLCGIIQLLLQQFAGLWPLELWVFGILLNILWMYITLKICTTLPQNSLIYCTMKAFIFAEFLASFCWCVSLYLFLPKSATLHPLLILTTLVLYFVIAYLYLKLSRPLQFGVKTISLQQKDIINSFITSFMIFIISNLGFALYLMGFPFGDSTTIFIFRMMVNLLGLTIFYIQDNQRQEFFLKNELQAINQAMHYQHQQYEQYRINNKQINQKVHDLKYQLELLKLQDYNSDLKEQIINDLSLLIKQHDTQIKTDNPVLATILTQKNVICLNNDIAFTCMIEANTLDFMDAMDLYSLLGNALDNAIEATCKLEKTHRIINLRIYIKSQFVIISIENPFDGSITLKDGLPQTTKKNAFYHGYGMKSMNYIVEKYQGNTLFDIEDNWFTFTILLPKR